MSLLRAFPTASTVPQFFPRLAFLASQSPVSQWQRFNLNSFGTHSAAYASGGISFSLPGMISDIWESILRAVPKKKTSHMKRRHRQMAGKALKDAKNLNSCSGCGQPKKAHTLCPTCVGEIREQWRNAEKNATTAIS